MKTLLIALFAITASFTYAQKATFHVEFKGIEEGYDHVVKEELYLDGVLIKVTEEHRESENVDIKLKLKKGPHTFKVVSWTLYNGTWEQMTQDNDYSLDGFKEITYEFKKKNAISIVFDLDDRDSPYLTIK